MPDVSLVLMPFAAVERPSLALGLLKAGLSRQNISCRITHANLLFAGEIGADVYNAFCCSLTHHLVGEWLFAEAAFPDHPRDPAPYLEAIKGSLLVMESIGEKPKAAEYIMKIRGGIPDWLDRLARAILAEKPKIVGCSSTFQQQCASLALLRRIRELDPGVITMMGGANCEAPMGTVMHREFRWVDYIVSGEADDLLPPLCHQLMRRGRDLPVTELPGGVMGPAHRQDLPAWIQRWRDHPPRATVTRLDQLPTPDFTDYFDALRESPIAGKVRPGLVVETARGCWWGARKQCSFCGLNGNGISPRRKTPVRFLAEITELSDRHQMKDFDVADNMLEMEFLRTLVPRLGELPGQREIFYEVSAGLNREQIKSLAGAGVRWMQPGLESMDDDILRLLRKGTSVTQNIQFLKWAREFGVYVTWLFLYGVPGEKDDSYRCMSEWLPLLSHLQPPDALAFVQFNRYSPYHIDAARYDLRLQPEWAYGQVYPLPEESLQDLACFFDDFRDGVSRRTRFWQNVAIEKPGLTAFCNTIGLWQRQWARNFYPEIPGMIPANLSMIEEDGRLVITDTRACATANHHTLTGLEKAVYLAADQAPRRNVLRERLARESGIQAAGEEIDAVLAQLRDKKLIVRIHDRFISLAVRGPLKPSLRWSNFPGGHVETKLDRYLRKVIRDAAENQANLIAASLA
ncbi:MAG: RiPP maturation radical SAM C-methyltransferase [Verrucomicrobiae bacterium]|nr:RiPP maturation radical SAM C-methyltransferase [Verrucomicrobiae bacterium]